MLAMDSGAPRLASKHALSLTTIASKLAPTEDLIRLTEQHYAQWRGSVVFPYDSELAVRL
ncbi:hypothetical protein EMIT0P74_180075 [Pseudomonas sp. IT-P74]